jgi:hypothetical protein
MANAHADLITAGFDHSGHPIFKIVRPSGGWYYDTYGDTLVITYRWYGRWEGLGYSGYVDRYGFGYCINFPDGTENLLFHSGEFLHWDRNRRPMTR